MMMTFPKGAYNLLKLQFMAKNNPVYKNIGFDIETIKKAFYVTTKLYEIRSSPELAEILGIPKILAPFSHIKISGNEKYLINCNLVENRSSYSFKSTPGVVYPSRLLAVAPLRNGCYPELSIQSGKNIINNLTLEILTENLETPNFGDNEITYVLKVLVNQKICILHYLKMEMAKLFVSNKLVMLYKNSKTRLNIMKLCARSINDITIFFSKVSVSAGTLSFISSASGVGTALSGVGLPAGASPIGLVCGLLSVLTGAIAREVSHKVTKHEQTVAICQSEVNSIKDRISKALNDNKISDEEFHNIISELDKYNEMKRDIRTNNRKNIEKNIPNEADLKKQIRLEIMKKIQAVSINHLESK